GPTHADDGMVVVLWKGRTVPAALLFEIPAALTPGILSQQIRAARLPIAGLVNVSAKVGEAGFGAAEVDSIHPRHGEELHSERILIGLLFARPTEDGGAPSVGKDIVGRVFSFPHF